MPSRYTVGTVGCAKAQLEELVADDLGSPQRVLSAADAAAVIVGIVIGGGIFALPSLVAGMTGTLSWFLAAWIAGGLISVIGALCYAELACTYPDAGGDYHFLTRAFGQDAAFLFAWARLLVIQTGSIAVQAFIIGDYASEVVSLGAYSSAIYAAAVVILLTGLNMAGISFGKYTQNILSAAVVVGLLMVALAGIVYLVRGGELRLTQSAGPGGAMIGLAMVFVLFTFGGWNEGAYLSAEMRGDRRSILRALLLGLGIVTAIYLLANLAFVATLGLDGMASSRAVAADTLRAAFGDWGARALSLVVIVAVLSTINATVFTGGRSGYALGRDFPLLGFLGQWRREGSTPANALLVQGIIALVLVGAGAAMRKGVSSMVEYTAPVFWTFFLLAGISLIVMRFRDPRADRPFRVPLYPVTPLLFCAACGYMLWSSLTYHGVWALVGVGVVALGVPVLLAARRRPEPRGFAVIQPTEET